MRIRHKICCVACQQKILDSESNVVLDHAGTEERAFYHTRCAGGALAVVMLEPEVWIMSVRHVDEQAN